MRDLKHYLSEVEAIFDEETFIFEPRELYEPIDHPLSATSSKPLITNY